MVGYCVRVGLVVWGRRSCYFVGMQLVVFYPGGLRNFGVCTGIGPVHNFESLLMLQLFFVPGLVVVGNFVEVYFESFDFEAERIVVGFGVGIEIVVHMLQESLMPKPVLPRPVVDHGFAGVDYCCNFGFEVVVPVARNFDGEIADYVVGVGERIDVEAGVAHNFGVVAAVVGVDVVGRVFYEK